MTSRHHLALAICLATSLATASYSQSTGTVTLIVADQERTIPVWSDQSDWSGSENWPSINIYARDFSDNGEEPALISLSFEASAWQPSVPEMDMVLYENRKSVGKLFAREEAGRGGLIVTVDSHAFDGASLSLTGSFEATLGPSDNYGNDIDLSQGVPVTGTFDVVLEAME
ncbi:hypothetical protein AN191_03645 [Loktanella sp. 5RATIMAR09]|uniref:hypothetical protein n=1 Tax=Loktanella sp. 5RATIMAR09 TaxID=1225655 RepID=UPI0006EB5AD6|nr:hypothetical protein [Loktanella sp. 5RATIMAR09]KQI73008.1 hypothetical protein AN191_03645 [Loktanella sp. 5RATIMAR09]